MIESCREHGLPSPEFEEVATHFRVTLRLQGGAEFTIDDTSRIILKILQDKGQLNTRAIAEAIGRSSRSARTKLKALVERGLIAELGSGPTDPKRVYVLIRGGM